MVSRALIVGQATALRERVIRYLETQGIQVDVVEEYPASLERAEQAGYDLLLVDLRALGVEARALLQDIAHSCPGATLLLMSGAEQRPVAIEALRTGAYDVLDPADDWQVEFSLSRAWERARLVRKGSDYCSLLNNFPGVVFWGSSRFEIELIQGRVLELTGYPPEAFIEQGLRWDAIIHAPDLAETFPQVRQSITRGEQSTLQFRLERPDGELRWVECVLSPVIDVQGRIQSVSGIVFDIAERKQAELELSQHVQEQETVFAIGQMVSSSLQIDEVLQQVAEQMTRLVNAASCVISDWDADSARLTVQTIYVQPGLMHSDAGLDEVGRTYDVPAHSVAAKALREREPVVVYAHSLPGEQRERRLQLYHAVTGIPLLVKGRVIGLAEVYLSGQGQSFELRDLRLLQSLANQVAVAIDNARLFSVAQANEAAMRDLSLRLINVQEQERRYIAQELHDELGQILTATKIDIDLARRRVCRLELDDLAPAQARLEEASALTDEMLTRVRAMTVELRPLLLDDMGIVPTLRWHLGRFAARSGVQAQLDASELPTRLQAEIETTIYRVVQEALTNVLRHAQASQVRVRLLWQGDIVFTSIEDDGQGFDVRAWLQRSGEQQQTLGIIGIRERVMLLDGRADIKSQAGHGTRIEIELPARFRVENE